MESDALMQKAIELWQGLQQENKLEEPVPLEAREQNPVAPAAEIAPLSEAPTDLTEAEPVENSPLVMEDLQEAQDEALETQDEAEGEFDAVENDVEMPGTNDELPSQEEADVTEDPHEPLADQDFDFPEDSEVVSAENEMGENADQDLPYEADIQHADEDLEVSEIKETSQRREYGKDEGITGQRFQDFHDDIEKALAGNFDDLKASMSGKVQDSLERQVLMYDALSQDIG